MDRRSFIAAAAGAAVCSALSHGRRSRRRARTPRRRPPGAPSKSRHRLEIANAGPSTRAWIPVPALNSDWQQSQPSTWRGNMREAALVTDPATARRWCAWPGPTAKSRRRSRSSSRIRTRDRNTTGANRHAPRRAGGPRREPQAHRAHSDRRHRGGHRGAGGRRQDRPTSTRRARCTTGSSPTPIASRRCAAAASATSRACSRRRTWAASART